MPDLIVVSEAGTVTVVEGSGTVYGVSVVSANGFAGSVAKDTTTPQITITTSINGLLAGDGTAIFKATAGTGLSYDDITGILTNSEPDQTVVLTDGADITITGTYPSFTIAYSGAVGGVSSLIAGTGISLDVTTGDITVTNSEPDQTVVLTNGAGITVTGTYPSFTIDCDITQYADADARLAISAGTGITYDNTTGIITNDDPDQTVVLTNGTGITVTGTYPSFTVANSLPDQTVVLTNGTDITITGTYPSFTIAYSGAAGGSGTVTKASVVSANGFAGTVATDTTTPAITITTSITGILKGNATAISAATAGTDYVVPSGSITGSAASLSATLAVASGGTGVTTSTGSGANALATSAALTTPTITGLIEVKTAPTISAGVLALNCALGNVFAVSLNAAITSITFSNIPTTGNAYGLTLLFVADGTARAVTWPAAVKWSGGTAPTLTSTSAKTDIFVLTTIDGGTVWFAMIGGQNH
jgi:hypothetical protein